MYCGLHSNSKNTDFLGSDNLDRYHTFSLQMLSKCLEQIEDEDWTALFGESLANQIVLYDKLPAERVCVLSSFPFYCPPYCSER